MAVHVSGQVVNVEGVSVDRGPVDFYPSQYTAARERNDGTGGRTAARTSNADGPYRVTLWFGLQRRDEDPGMGRIFIQLPPDVQAGRSYVLRDSRRASEGEAYGALLGPHQAWSLHRGLDGKVHVVEFGDTISFAFEFRNDAEPDSDSFFEASGRAYRVSMRPRPEATFTVTVGGERTEHVEGLTIQDRINDYNVHASTFWMSWMQSLQPGEYRLASERSDGVVVVRVAERPEGNVQGTLDGSLHLKSDGQHYTAEFNFTSTGDMTLQAEGRMEFLPLSEH